MKNIIDEACCPECSAKIESIFEGHLSGTRCTNCNWSVFTTYFKPIEKDLTEYEVFVTPTFNFTNEQIKIVANLLNINFLQAREKLMEKIFKIYKGKAKEILTIKEYLNSVGLHYQIYPEFNW